MVGGISGGHGFQQQQKKKIIGRWGVIFFNGWTWWIEIVSSDRRGPLIYRGKNMNKNMNRHGKATLFNHPLQMVNPPAIQIRKRCCAKLDRNFIMVYPQIHQRFVPSSIKKSGHQDLLELSREWGNGMVISSDYGSFPRSMSINWTCRWTHDEPMSPPCHQIPQSLLSFSHNWLLGQTSLAMPWIKIHTDTALCAWHCALGGGVFPSRLSLH